MKQNRPPIVVGNWKMNTDRSTAVELARAIAKGLGASAPGVPGAAGVEVGVCPPYVYIDAVASVLREARSPIAVGGQDLYFEYLGAFTGEISASMLKDVGATMVIAGHSERRHMIGETDFVTNKKLLAALAAGLISILCIGETLDQRQAGLTDTVNERQLRLGLAGVDPQHLGRLVIAYEPVWAIGTGKTATPADAQGAHQAARGILADLFGQEAADGIRIQYGGSVKPDNAAELFAQPDIDGGLIGGASLKADDFLAIVRAAGRSG